MFEFAPGIAYAPIPQLSIGGAFYLDYAMMDMARTTPIGRYTEDSNGLAFSGIVGVKIKPIDMLSFGVIFKPKRTVTMSGSASVPELAGMQMPTSSDFDREVSWPMEIRGGTAVQPISGLTLAVDARYIFWEDACDVFDTEYAQPSWEAAMDPNDSDKFILHWEDTLQYNVGVEYQANPMFAVRGGYYHDPAPGPDSTHNILIPNNDFDAITGGVGVTVNRFDINAGFEYLIGKDREIPVSQATDHNMVGTHTLNMMVTSVTVNVDL
jgi:long-chain fatty acid transport protein